MQKRLLLTIASLLVCTMAAIAQITNSSMAGKVILDGTAEDVIGATVQVVHEPSGTRYGAVTNTRGRFNIQGMRNGGPYTVTVSYIGFQTQTFRNITLELGETYNLNVTLSENASELGEIVVSGKASKFAAEKTGASTNITNQQILEIPTISRSIGDITKLSPYSGGSMSFAGGDGRSSNFTLDGANLNNNFGLSSSLPGGGNPVSMDAIDEVQVVVAPFDVRQSNFIGGGVNAVTKSGTNLFKGTAYIYHNNENMHGNRIDDEELAARDKQRETVYGFTLGGPIIKDKLFFFANYEHSYSPTVVNRWRASEDGVGDETRYISSTTLAEMEQVSNYMSDTYGYSTGSWTSYPAESKNNKFLVRLDWNITKDHHLAVRYNYTKDQGWTATNRSSTAASRSMSDSRFSQYSMAFANSIYSTDKMVRTISADLNSRFGQSASNQLLFTYTKQEDGRGSPSAKFPFVDIMAGYETAANGTVTQDFHPFMSVGYEPFTWNNGVQNNILTLTDNFTYYLGAHKLMAGVSFEHQMANNNFMRYGTGYYRFRSLDDFLTGAAPETVSLTHGYGGNEKPSNEVRFNQLGLYLQDEWNMTDNFKLTAGIRFDNIKYDEADIMTNTAIYELDFGGRHIDTGHWPNSNIQISPRIGFSWDIFGDKSLKLRGGTGLFAGRLPLVFFTNMPTNSGMIQNSVTATTTYKGSNPNVVDPRLAQFAGGLVTDIDKIRDMLGGPANITPQDGVVTTNIVGVDPDFKMPQGWKSSLAIDYNVPVSFPLTLTAEATYTKKINDVVLENYNIKPIDETWQRFSGADDRYIYPKDFTYYPSSKLQDAIVLKNTHKGYGWTANVTVNAEPVKNLRLMAAYTHTVVKEVSGMPGSQANSTWKGNYTINGPNFAKIMNSRFVTPDRVIASVSYKYAKEHFSLYYSGYSPSGYSFFYDGDINGDGIGTGDLMYIPANDSEIHFVDIDGYSADQQRADFWNFVEQDKYLRNHKGEYAESYSARSPWNHRFDFKWAHDFDLRWGLTKHRLQLSVDIMNVANLFNSRWGVAKTLACNGGKILKYVRTENNVPYFQMCKNADGTTLTDTWDYNHVYDQCWRMQVGLKYYFDQLSAADVDDKKPARQHHELSQDVLDRLNAELSAAKAENTRLMSQLSSQPKVKPAEPKVVTVTDLLAAPVSVFFNLGKSVLASPRELQNVEELARVAKARNVKLIVTGYADSQTGTVERNQELSRQRAQVLADELVRLGVSRSNIEVVAGGAVDALSPNDYNRRAVITVKK